MSQLLTIVLSALLFIGCADDHPSRSTADLKNVDNKSQSDLSGKSVEEILKLKYEKATLVCNFWYQYGSEFLKSAEPNLTIQYDLKKKGTSEYGTNPETRGLSVHNQDMKLTFVFGPVQIHDLNLNNENGDNYRMFFSPHLEVNFQWEVSDSKGFARKDVIEKLTTKVVEQSVKNGDDLNSYLSHFECAIVTDIRPKYKNQFSFHKSE
jgi:hypothetical protein